MRMLSVSMLGKTLCAGLMALALGAGAGTLAPNTTFEKKGDLAKNAFKEIRHVTVDAKDNVYVCGDNQVKVFDSTGKEIASWTAPSKMLCLTVDKDGFAYGAAADKIFKFSNDMKGTVVTSFGTAGKNYGQLASPSGIACNGNSILVTDAANSCIHRYGKDGKFIEDIGRTAVAKRGSFATCCGILDAAVGKDGKIYVANLGAHRVEVYQNGRMISNFGKAGNTPNDFCGCCNPTNMAIAANGEIITTEKTIPRIKIFSRDGKKMLALIGADNFNKDCYNMYVAVDSKYRVYAVDNGSNCVRIFEAK